MLRKPIYHNKSIRAEASQHSPAPTGSNATTKPKIEVPKFKTLLKMIKSSESSTLANRTPKAPPPVRHNDFNEFHSRSQHNFESSQYTSTDANIKQQMTKPKRHHYNHGNQQQQAVTQFEPGAAHLDAKTQRIITYRNLLKTTREKFKKNLIDYMNKQKEDKVVRNIGYRFSNLPALSRSTFRTQETNETAEDEKMMFAASEIFNEEFQSQTGLNSKSLPNLYYKRLSADDRHIDVKLPNVLPASTATPSTMKNAPHPQRHSQQHHEQQQQEQQAMFTTDKSLKEDSLFWSKYKTTINRRMKNNQIPPIQFNSNSSAKFSSSNVDSLAEQDFKKQLYNDKQKFAETSQFFNYDSQISRFKTPLSGSRFLFGDQDDIITTSSESVLATLTNRMSDVSVKNL